ncbi:MAG: hypothetical protein FWH07_06905 [Oscillospiraceae bacterium]|nr:hypothetical protein [Oscillospiraceae bacterium]
MGCKKLKTTVTMLLVVSFVFGLTAMSVTAHLTPTTFNVNVSSIAAGGTFTDVTINLKRGDRIGVNLTFTPLATLPGVPRSVEFGYVNANGMFTSFPLSMGNNGGSINSSTVLSAIPQNGIYRFRIRNTNLGVPVRVSGSYTVNYATTPNPCPCGGIFQSAVGYDIFNIWLRVEDSALNSVLTMDVYQQAIGPNGWNQRSNNVRISRVSQSVANESASGHTRVAGANFIGGNFPLRAYGQVLIYNATGVLLQSNTANANSFWGRSELYMNRDVTAYGGIPSATLRRERAVNVFLHEVGHVLKLAHPGYDYTQYTHPPTHGYNDGGLLGGWFPISVMNQGLRDINTPHLPISVTNHDTTSLRAKWGN